MTIPWLALLVPLLEHWYIKTEALSFLYDDMDIISINNWTGNTVSLLTFCGGVNTWILRTITQRERSRHRTHPLSFRFARPSRVP